MNEINAPLGGSGRWVVTTTSGTVYELDLGAMTVGARDVMLTCAATAKS